MLLVLTMLTGLVLATGGQTTRATAAVPVPAKPVLAAHSYGNATFSFSWTEPTTDGSVTDYEYSFKRSSTSTWGASTSTAGATSAVVTGLTNGQLYNFRVRARSAGGASSWGSQVSATPRPVPGTPGSITTQPQGTTVLLGWAYPANDDGEPVSGFQAQVRESGGSFGSPIAIGGGAATSYSLTGLLAGKTYYLQLRSINQYGSGSWSSLMHFTVPSATLAAPKDLTATARSGGVGLAWSMADPSSATFEVRHRVAASGASWVSDPSTSDLTAEISGLQDGTSYLFDVRAVTSSGASAWVEVRQTPGVRPEQMATPTATIADDKTSVRVSWVAAPPEGLVGYDVNWYPKGGGSKTVRVPASETSYLLTDLPTSVVYYAKVRAVNSVGTGSYSSTRLMFVPKLSMPTMRISTTNAAPIVDTETYVPGSYGLDPNGSSVNAQSGTLTIKGHGNTTWGQPKKPYRLKLDSKASLMGLPSNKNWILLANYRDRTMLRNDVALHLGQQTNLAWTPKSAFVEVILNGQYQGLYQLAEQVRIDTNRVNINSMSPTDTSGSALTGGYLIERDQKYDPLTESGFYTSRNLPFSLKDPDPPTSEQLGYISSYVQQTEDAVLSTPLDDPTNGYRNFIDVPSFVEWYLVEEYVRNGDVWNSSAYMYKPRDGKLFMGPLWDFDLSQGRAAADSSVPTGWYARTKSPWFARLFKDPAFKAAFDQRWREMRPAIAALPAYVDGEASRISAAEAVDKARWGYTDDFATDVTGLKQWLTTRADWIDSQVPSAPAAP